MERDIFIALVAIVIGGFLCTMATTNNEQYFSMRTPERLNAAFGRTIARIIIGLMGCFLIGTSIFVASISIQYKSSAKLEYIPQFFSR